MGFKQNLRKIIALRDYKKFRDNFNSLAFDQFHVNNFMETKFNKFNKHALIKRKYFRTNTAPYMTKGVT